MEKIRFRGRFTIKHSELIVSSPYNITEERHEKTRYKVKKDYVNEFLFKKYRNAMIEFSAYVEKVNEHFYLKNINDIKKNNFSYKEEERRVNLSKFKSGLFIGTYRNFSNDKKGIRFFFTDIKTLDGEFIADHVFLEFDSHVVFNIKKEYIFIANIKKYKKRYSNEFFYGFKTLKRHHISPYQGVFSEISDYKELFYKNKNHLIKFKALFLKKRSKSYEFSDLEAALYDKNINKIKKMNIPVYKNDNYNLLELRNYLIEVQFDYRIIIKNQKNYLIYYPSVLKRCELMYIEKKVKKFSDIKKGTFYVENNHIINLENGEKIKKTSGHKIFKENEFFIGSVQNGKIFLRE